VLIVIDPIARQTDGESVRIARDVLRAGTHGARVCLLERPQEMSRAMAGLSSGRVVVVGDDRALLRAVRALHHRGDLAEHPLGVVPVGPPHALSVSLGLGLSGDAVRASRAVLGGTCRELDLLVDDAGGVVLGALGIPAPRQSAGIRRGWWRGWPGRGADHWLRVEADGQVLADLDRPVREITVSASGGKAAVLVRHGATDPAVTARAESVTVSGQSFRYHADTELCGPAHCRTWRVRPAALRLSLPAPV
jgi:diacylglycerol kinase family enzyme